jgi:transposase InsO family protein
MCSLEDALSGKIVGYSIGPRMTSGRGSMGRVAAGDNARMESFHSLLQNNVLDSKKWESQEELRIAIVRWIEGTHHRRRRKRSLGKMTPVEYEVAAEAVDKELLVA